MTDSSRRPAIFISYPLPEEAVELARARVAVDVNTSTDPLAHDQLIARLKGREGLISLITDAIDETLLAACPELRVVANVAVGFNNVDVAAATRRGVVITNTPDVLTDSTADYAWALLMTAARRVVEADRYVREGRWKKWDFDLLWGADVHGKTLGIVGFGRIGRAVARRARGFAMRVLYQDAAAADPATERDLGAQRVDLATLLRESDFVTLHTPLTADTRHLIDAAALRAMKKTAVLVNASRGPVVDEAALAQALGEGQIAGAGLGVFEQEPEIHPGLLGLPNVVLSPHLGSASLDTRRKMCALAVENCLAVLEGRTPPTPVNPEALSRPRT